MKSLKLVMNSLSVRQRFIFIVALLARVCLGALDVAGVALVGLSVSMVSGLSIGVGSLNYLVANAVQNLGIANPYAVVACLAIVFFIVKALLAISINKAVSSWVGKIETEVSFRIYSSFLSSNLNEVERINSKKLAHGLIHGTHLLFGNLLLAFATAVTEISMMTLIGIYLLVMNPMAFFVTGMYFGVFGWLMYAIVNRRNRGLWQRQEESHVSAQTHIQESSDNYRQLWSLGRQEAFAEKFRRDRSSISHVEAQLGVNAQLPRYLTEIAVMGGIGLLLAARTASGGLLSASVIAVFLTGAFRIVASMLPLQGAMSTFKDVEAGSSGIRELIREFDQNPNKEATAGTLSRGQKGYELREVAARYRGSKQLVFSDLSLEIPHGSLVALVGPSGSGKSTFLDILLGLRPPANGSIAYDGVNLAERISHGQRLAAYVPQRMTAISGSMRENLVFGLNAEDISDETLMDLIEKFGLSELIRTLPEGLDTVLTGPSGGLSGGQLQRLGVIRSILEAPKVVALDEATSGLDSATAQKVLKALSSELYNSTIILSTHDETNLHMFDIVIRFSLKGTPTVSFSEAFKGKLA